MKTNIITLIVVLIIPFFSCSSQSQTRDKHIEIIDDVTYKPLEGKIVVKGDDDLTNAFDITIVDSLCILIDWSSHGKIFRSYSFADFRKEAFWGERGQGPQDYFTPFFFNTRNKVKNHLDVLDLNTAKRSEIRVHNKKLEVVENQSMPQLLYTMSINQLDDYTYVGAKPLDSSQGIYLTFNSQKNETKWVDYPTALDKKTGNNKYILMNTLLASKEHDFISCAMRYFNKLLFFDLKGNLIKKFVSERKSLCPNGMKKRKSSRKHHNCSFWICIQQTNIYTICM